MFYYILIMFLLRYDSRHHIIMDKWQSLGYRPHQTIFIDLHYYFKLTNSAFFANNIIQAINKELMI